MSDLLDFLDFYKYAKRSKVLEIPRRYVRDYSDPFKKYSITEFHSRYRFTQDVVKNLILPIILPDLERPTKRGLPFAPEIMLLLTLRYFATGSYQKLIGEPPIVCQPTASRLITRVTKLIAVKMKNYVKFPDSKEGLGKVKQQFYEIAHFPEVIGCIDCIHIKIKCPSGTNSELYRYKKRSYSVKVQAVAGPNLEFYDLSAEWPGRTDKSVIYNSSSIRQSLANGDLEGYILGDNGYDVSGVLLTPFQSPVTNSQESYNRSHFETWSTIERCLGIWKRRFGCLQIGMNLKIDTVVSVICACATLHNVALPANDLSLMADYWAEELADEISDPDVTEDPESEGFLMRQSLVERFFT